MRRGFPRPAGPALLPALLVLALLPAARPEAEVKPSVKITALGTLFDSGGAASLLGLARASLDLESAGSRDVKAFLQIDSFVGNGLSFDVPRAYIRARLPGFRAMIGRNRVSWGDGFYFNAGDVIFGSMDPTTAGFTADTLRDQTDWLAELYVPLGQFSYLEGVFLPFAGVGPASTADPATGAVRLGESAAGLRAVTRVGNVKLEGGYLFNGLISAGHVPAHRPYVALQGHLGVDWFLAASLEVPAVAPDLQDVADGLDVSAGVYTILSPPFGESLSLRLEAGLQPYRRWTPTVFDPLAPVDPGYGLYLFPEAVLAVSPSASLQLRALISPVDGSAFIQSGVSWNIYQGLTLLGYAAVMAGDGNDLFGWNQPGSPAFTLGMEYIY